MDYENLSLENLLIALNLKCRELNINEIKIILNMKITPTQEAFNNILEHTPNNIRKLPTIGDTMNECIRLLVCAGYKLKKEDYINASMKNYLLHLNYEKSEFKNDDNFISQIERNIFNSKFMYLLMCKDTKTLDSFISKNKTKPNEENFISALKFYKKARFQNAAKLTNFIKKYANKNNVNFDMILKCRRIGANAGALIIRDVLK
jgi:hypothetical protein